MIILARPRVRLECEAVLLILDSVRRGEHVLLSSEAVEDEIRRNPDAQRRHGVQLLLRLASEVVRVGEDDWNRASGLIAMGLHAMDAIHVACAIGAGCDAFLTTDDRLERLGRRIAPPGMWIGNPAAWILENA